MSSPLLWGPNNTSNNLQNKIKLASNQIVGIGLDAWTTATSYLIGQQVVYGQQIYSCLVDHTSSSFIETDLAGTSPKWKLIQTQATTQNLMTYGFDFECGDTAGWTAVGCATVTNGLLASNGSGGAVFSSTNGGRTKGVNTTSPAVVSSGQLDGSYSLNFATSGAGTIGDMYISSAYKIPIAFQSTVLQLKFKYKVVSGSPVMSGTSSNTYAAAIYDIDNNSWSTMPLVGSFNFVQGSGVGTFTGTVQVPYNSTQFQIAIYNPVAPTGASSLYLDDFYFGPQITSTGPAMSDWKSYTPTITHSSGGLTNATVSGKYRQVGDSIELFGNITFSAASAAFAEIFVSLPSGLTFDTSKMATSATLAQNLGTCFCYDSGNILYAPGNVVYRSASIFDIRYVVTASGATPAVVQTAGISNTVPFTYGANDSISWKLTAPITGWSSNTVMSADTDTRVIAASLAQTSTGTTITGTAATVSFNVVTLDTANAFSTSTYRYTIPVTGYYKATFPGLVYVTALTTAGRIDSSILKSGTAVARSTSRIQSTGFYPLIAPVFEGLCNAGEYLECTVGTSEGTFTVATHPDPNYMKFQIERLSGPAVIAATETVAARYTNTSGSAVANTETVLDFPVKDYDSHNAVTTGANFRFIAPTSGIFEISVNILTNASATASSLVGRLRKNGTAFKSTVFPRESAVSSYTPLVIQSRVRLLSQEYVDFVLNETVDTNTLDTTLGANSFEVIRVGNYV